MAEFPFNPGSAEDIARMLVDKAIEANIKPDDVGAAVAFTVAL